jgi:syntaxin-binding protein 1
MVVSLPTLIRNRYLETIRSVQPASVWKIVVVDQHSKGLIDSVLKVYDILDEKVQQIDILENNRSNQSRLEAIYFLLPTKSNVERVLNDFGGGASSGGGGGKKGQQQPQQQPWKYAAAHLFFIDGNYFLSSREI